MDGNIEQMIQEKQLNAPRVTKLYLETLITNVQYHQFEGTTVTVCCLEVRNGSSIIGESACASPENFNAEVGKAAAYENAFAKLWPLEGYLLRQQLSEV